MIKFDKKFTGARGFEPRLQDPKSCVLPVGRRPSNVIILKEKRCKSHNLVSYLLHISTMDCLLKKLQKLKIQSGCIIIILLKHGAVVQPGLERRPVTPEVASSNLVGPVFYFYALLRLCYPESIHR